MENVITPTKIKEIDYYSMVELYDYVDLAYSQYTRWVKTNLLTVFEEGSDYLFDMMSNNNFGKKGRTRQDYRLTVETAKHLALMSRTEKGKEYRASLITQESRIESGELFNHQEAFVAMEVLNCLSVKENRQEIEKMHFAKFVANGGSKYDWHNYRNQILGASKESLLSECARLGIQTKEKDTREMLWVRIDHFGLIRETALEFALVGGAYNPRRFANIVYGFAKIKNLPFTDTNDPNLFYQPIPVLVAQSLLLT